MRIRGLLVSVFAAVLLSGCNTVEGVGKDVVDIDNWFGGRPSAMEKSAGRIPTGYAGQNQRGVLKPPGFEAQQLPPQETPADGLTWNEVGDYSAPVPAQAPVQDDLAPVTMTAPQEQASVQWTQAPAAPPATGQAYNKDVMVFPLDGEAPAYAYTTPSYTAGAYTPPVAFNDYGQLVQQIYFAHGSATLGKADVKNLQQLAQGIKRTADDVSVTVVGHASKRVDGVTDPIRKKMINFEMAQKRANAVTRELKKSGVNPAWVRTVSQGDDAPNPAPGTRSQEDADRRAEVYMDSK